MSASATYRDNLTAKLGHIGGFDGAENCISGGNRSASLKAEEEGFAAGRAFNVQAISDQRLDGDALNERASTRHPTTPFDASPREFEHRLGSLEIGVPTMFCVNRSVMA